MSNTLTQGSITKNLLKFSIPFLISSFLQTFYGLADLFIAGQFNGASTITAVSVGSQIMHMVTVIIIGFVMGTTVFIARNFAVQNFNMIKKIIAMSLFAFLTISLIITLSVYMLSPLILDLLSTPPESIGETIQYLRICILGTFFITLYNIQSSIFRGIGNSQTPMYFVALSGIINIAADYIFIGVFCMGARGAALATLLSQIVCAVSFSLYAYKKLDICRINREDLVVDFSIIKKLLSIGLPVACQDGFIQISFLIITMIANIRGVTIAASVGIVEKLISFMFLVPSAMLSSVSAICAQNAGAGNHKRADNTLFCSIAVCFISGVFFTVICELFAENILYLFSKNDSQVVMYGAQYLRTYVLDCIFAGFHFCFSGYFCAYEKSLWSFIHNLAAIILVRIPGAYLASVFYPTSLMPMGLSAPAGSLFSTLICIIVFLYMRKQRRNIKNNF